MMNLEKMKKNKEKRGKLQERTQTVKTNKRDHKTPVKKAALAVGSAICMISMLCSPVHAEEETESREAKITIEKPSRWMQGNTTISVIVDGSHLGEGVTVSKIEAKVGEDGNWQDITGPMSIDIHDNTTVYVRVLDSAGNYYEQNRSIRCYDSEKPTLAAALSDGVLTIKGTDTVSGIKSITVNGTTYKDLNDGTLKVQLTQKDFTTKKIEIYCTDKAGNSSELYSMQNPYYEWAVKQAAQQAQQNQQDGMTTSTPADGSDGSGQTTTPLPQDATPSDPTSATGTVDDRTVTGIEQELAQNGEQAESITQTSVKGGKEFYTISTKSGKIFYLIVDNDAQQDNVYFLTEVSEKDLMNFTLSDTVTLPDVDTVYATVDTPETETEAPQTEAPQVQETEPETEAVVMPEDKKDALGSYLLIGLIAAGVGGAGYYFKIYKPNHEDYDYDESEGMVPEPDEPVEREEPMRREAPEQEPVKEHPVMKDEEDSDDE